MIKKFFFASALVIMSIPVMSYEPFRGASNSYKAASSAMLAGIIYQKASITTKIFSDDAVEPLLKTIFDKSDEFFDHYDKSDFVAALHFYIEVGKHLPKEQLVTDQFRDYIVKRYIDENCGV